MRWWEGAPWLPGAGGDVGREAGQGEAHSAFVAVDEASLDESRPYRRLGGSGAFQQPVDFSRGDFVVSCRRACSGQRDQESPFALRDPVPAQPEQALVKVAPCGAFTEVHVVEGDGAGAAGGGPSVPAVELDEVRVAPGDFDQTVEGIGLSQLATE